MADARPSFFDFDVTRFMADFRFSPIDLETWMAYQRRNLEAFTQAHQVAVEGVQAVARKQIEMARQSIEDTSALLRDLAQPVSAEERIAKNTEYAKQLLEKGVNHSREVAGLAAKASTDAATILQRRATESLDELRAFTSQQTAQQTAK